MIIVYCFHQSEHINKRGNNKSLNLIDKELKHIHRPNKKIVGEYQGDLVHWMGISTDRRYPADIKYDNQGFRNNHNIEEAPMIVIGDSFLEWGLVPQANLVSSLLNKTFNVEVANLSQANYGPQQELIVLNRYGLKLQPEVIIWFFFEGNDIRNTKTYDDIMADWDKYLEDLDSFNNRSFTKNTMIALTRLVASKPKKDLVFALSRSGNFFSNRDNKEIKIYFGFEGLHLSEEEISTLKRSQEIILKANEKTVKAGANFLFLYIYPLSFVYIGNVCDFPNKSLCKDWQLNDLPLRMEKWCQKKQYPVS